LKENGFSVRPIAELAGAAWCFPPYSQISGRFAVFHPVGFGRWVGWLGGWVPPGSVHLLTGYSAGGFTAHIVASGYRVAPGYDPDGTRGADLALLTLAASAEAVMPLADDAPAPDTAVGGYNQDRAEIIEADAHCRVIGRSLLVRDCSATRGTSSAAAGGGEAGRHSGRRARGGAGGLAVPVETLRQMLAPQSKVRRRRRPTDSRRRFCGSYLREHRKAVS
jgi:hypothetical protein